MSLYITDDCINCAACEEDCPNEAVRAGDETYVIDAGKCTECEGDYDEPQCIENCPIDDCILPLPAQHARTATA